ncbi:hypothetical protein AMJ85_00265 [candidate division BRC1 bacterium SM23_51]|nr:MAG: hypothetical protein AMJ85_00265 [candidate division BRC1 bacterium SM23_51]
MKTVGYRYNGDDGKCVLVIVEVDVPNFNNGLRDRLDTPEIQGVVADLGRRVLEMTAAVANA